MKFDIENVNFDEKSLLAEVVLTQPEVIGNCSHVAKKHFSVVNYYMKQLVSVILLRQKQ